MNKTTRTIDVVELSVDELNDLLKPGSDLQKYGIRRVFTNSEGHKVMFFDEDFYREVVIRGID